VVCLQVHPASPRQLDLQTDHGGAATIRTIEQHPRGLFAGPIGVVKPDGDGEMIVGIRSMWLKQQTATLFAGAGILADSDVQAEFEETGLKMTPMMNLLKEQDK